MMKMNPKMKTKKTKIMKMAQELLLALLLKYQIENLDQSLDHARDHLQKRDLLVPDQYVLHAQLGQVVPLEAPPNHSHGLDRTPDPDPVLQQNRDRDHIQDHAKNHIQDHDLVQLPDPPDLNPQLNQNQDHLLGHSQGHVHAQPRNQNHDQGLNLHRGAKVEVVLAVEAVAAVAAILGQRANKYALIRFRSLVEKFY